MGWLGKYWAPSTTVAGLFLTGLYIYLQLLQWRKHGDDYLPLAAVIIVTAILWVVLIVATIRNWRDARRAAQQKEKNKELNDYNNQLVGKLALKQEEIAEMEKRYEGNIEALKYQHAKVIRDARTVVINSARWGIGGPYSGDVTSLLQFYLTRVEGLTASSEIFGDAHHPGEPKFLEVKFVCPCSAVEKRHVFRENEVIDFEALCR